MKKVSLSLLSVVSMGFASFAFAEGTSQVNVPVAPAAAPVSSNFTAAQSQEIEKIIANYLTKHPEVVMNAFQAGMAQQQKEAVAKMEKAVAENKDKIFNNPATPIGGNPKGATSLVVFLDPNCGYCKKFHKELETLVSTDKDVKIIYKDIPIMGPASVMTVKAMLAAKEQGKYDQFQKVVFSSDKPLTKKQLLKLASSVDIDTKKLEADMKTKEIQALVDQDLELAKVIGINGTPTLIIGEKKVVPGYVSAEELKKMLQESTASSKQASEKAS
ncbi:MAG: DsbA family protein [Alphaproteobacteria bacterium]|nr:DsbA family protein [Alphaproteobacteria bacterium]